MRGQVKLLDFGTARLVDATAEAAITKTGVFAFTPEYASPEQVRGEPVTFASDLYSAGVLLYRLLTGRLPYRIADASPAGVAAAIARAQPEPSGLDAPLDAILSKALSKDAAGRYQSAAEMDADLARYLEGQRVRARKPRKKFWAAHGGCSGHCRRRILGWRALRAPTAHQLIPFDAGVPERHAAGAFQRRQMAGLRGVPSPEKTGRIRISGLNRCPDGAAKRVTAGEAANDEPSLSPDGRWLAFHSTRAPAGHLSAARAAAAGRSAAAGGGRPQSRAFRRMASGSRI